MRRFSYYINNAHWQEDIVRHSCSTPHTAPTDYEIRHRATVGGALQMLLLLLPLLILIIVC